LYGLEAFFEAGFCFAGDMGGMYKRGRGFATTNAECREKGGGEVMEAANEKEREKRGQRRTQKEEAAEKVNTKNN
jgi:hypothetical protein